MSEKPKHEHTFGLVVTVTVRSGLKVYPLERAKKWAAVTVKALVSRWDPETISVVSVAEVPDAR